VDWSQLAEDRIEWRGLVNKTINLLIQCKFANLFTSLETVSFSRKTTGTNMRVLRQCTVPRAEVMFVTIQSENIRPSKKEMNKAVT
jgi:hypothetical protein